MSVDCVFCAISAGSSPASMVHRDDVAMVFMDLFPQTRGHALVVPHDHAVGLADLPPDTGAHLFRLAQRTAAALRSSELDPDGINLFLADGEVAGQEVFHVHLHVLPRYVDDGFRLDLNPIPQPTRDALDADAEAVAVEIGRHPPPA